MNYQNQKHGNDSQKFNVGISYFARPNSLYGYTISNSTMIHSILIKSKHIVSNYSKLYVVKEYLKTSS